MFLTHSITVDLLVCDRVEVGFAERGVGVHGLGPGLPVGRTYFAMLLNELESLDEANDLVYIAAHREVVACDLANDVAGIDDEESAQRGAGIATIGNNHAVLGGHVLVEVSEDWDVHRTKTALTSWCVDPRQMRKLGVTRRSDDLCVDRRELCLSVAEGNNFSWANEGKIEGIVE